MIKTLVQDLQSEIKLIIYELLINILNHKNKEHIYNINYLLFFIYIYVMQ